MGDPKSPEEKQRATATTRVAESEQTPEPSAQSSTPENMLPPGTVIGRYVVVQDIGRGGMGAVMLAYDTQLARRVAVKLLLTKDAPEEARLRMMREAQAMARLSHPNVVAIYDVGTHEGNIFLTMEFIEGMNLRQWVSTPHPWQEVLEVMKQAGRGLAAAHAAGLVHRDFKPANIVLGKDGRVCVLDFGIARAATLDATGSEISLPGAGPPSASFSHPSGAPGVTASSMRLPISGSVPPTGPSGRLPLLERLTEEGAIVGTIGYLAPEQAFGEDAGARSDVFSYCATLYRALYGSPPFTTRSLQDYIRAMSSPPPGRPRDSDVPAWLHPLILKGLSFEAEKRFASMEELLAALSDDPEKRRRRVAMTALGVASVGLIAFAAARGGAAMKSTPVCEGPAARIAEVWNPDVAAAVEAKFLGTGTPFASESARLAKEAISAYASRWADAGKKTCEATRVRKEQSEELMDVRMACLEQDRTQLRALVGVLRDADREIVGRSVQAIMALPSVDACADITSLMEVKAIPTTDKPRVEGARSELAGIRAELDSGRYRKVLSKVEPVVAQARAIGFEPLLAESLFVLGSAQHSSDNPKAAAAVLREAVFMAERGRDERLKISALIRLASVDVTLGRFDESELWLDFASASLARRPGNEGLEARHELGRATRAYIMGNYADAEAPARRAVTIGERRSAEDATTLWESYFRLGSILMAMDSPEGITYLDRADQLVVARLGALHPQRVRIAGNRIAALSLLHRDEEAQGVSDQLIGMAADVLSPTHRWTGILHARKGTSLLQMGRFGEALESFDHALAILKAAKDDREIGTTLTFKAQTMLALGKDKEAVAVGNEALEALEKAVPGNHEFVADALKTRAEARYRARDLKGAHADLERALAIYQAMARVRHVSEAQGEGRWILARVALDQGEPWSRVHDLAGQAKSAFEAAGAAKRVVEVDAWLETARAGKK